MTQTQTFKIKENPLLSSVFFFVIGILVSVIIHLLNTQTKIQEQENFIKEKSTNRIKKLDLVLNSKIIAGQALASYIEQNPNMSEEQLNAFVTSVFENHQAVATVTHSKQTQKNLIYSANGYDEETIFIISQCSFTDYYQDIWQNKNKNNEKLVQILMQVPLELEGKNASILVHIPIYGKANNNINYNINNINNNDEINVYDKTNIYDQVNIHSIATMSISLDKLFEAVGFASDSNYIDYAIAKYDSKNGVNTIWGNEELFSHNKIIQDTINLHTANWIVAATPKNGWINYLSYHLSLYIFFVSFATVLFYSMLKYRLILVNKIEAIYRIILSDSDDDALCVLDIDTMQYQFINANRDKILGFKTNKPKDFINLLTPDSFDNVVQKLSAEVEKYNAGKIEKLDTVMNIQCVNSNKETFWSEISVTAVPEDDGRIKKFLGILRNVDKQKSLETALANSENRYKIVTSNTNDMTCIMDLSATKFLFVGGASEKIFGYTPEELLQLPINQTMPAKSYNYLTKLLDSELVKYARGEKDFKTGIIFEIEQYNKLGEIIWVEVAAKVTKDANNCFSNVVATVRDIGKRKKAELEIAKQKAELDDLRETKDKYFSIISHDFKMAELEIAKQKTELDNLSKTKNEIYSTITNGLLIPLTEQLNISGMFADFYDEMNINATKQNVAILRKSSQHTYDLLANLLEWSKFLKGITVYIASQNSIIRIIENCIESLQTQAAAKNINIRFFETSKYFVMCDANMIQIVIRNLISNAIKFSYAGSTIELTVSDYKNTDYVQISVRDFGIGIEESRIDKVFVIDQNVSTKGTADEYGAGLGLILCKEFIDKHNCEIWVASQKDKGATFSFTLPKVINGC